MYYVGNTTDLRNKIITTLHCGPEGGHSVISATIKRIERLFYWPGLRADVTLFVKECITCQVNKSEHIKTPGKLQPIELPGNAWESISLDFIEGLPRSKGKDTILVIVDRFTKYYHLLPLTHPYIAVKVAQEVLDNVIKLHGMPQIIISDWDPIFISSFWKEMFTSLGTKVKLSSSYHPQTDGETERVNQCIEMFLRCIAGHKPGTWSSWLSLAEWWYNTSQVNEFLKDRKTTQQLIKDNLNKAQERMKWFADKKRSERSFAVGDEVYLKLQSYRKQSLSERRNHKLSANFYGPYTVSQKIGQVAYKLDLPASAKIHDIFHVSQLRKRSDKSRKSSTPSLLSMKLGFWIPDQLLCWIVGW